MSLLNYLIVLMFIFVASAGAAERSPTRVSVTRFSQEVQHVLTGCHTWVFTEQGQLQTELEADLSRKGLKVLERRNIRGVYENEFNLPNLNQKSVPKREKFLSAQYTITGGIAELGQCDDSSGSSVQLGGLVSLLGGPSDSNIKVRIRRTVSKVKLTAKLVSVETGEVLHSFTASSEVRDTGHVIRGEVMGIGAGHRGRQSPPIERATNQAIGKLADRIAAYLAR